MSEHTHDRDDGEDAQDLAKVPRTLTVAGALVGCGAGIGGAVLIPWALGSLLAPAPLVPLLVVVLVTLAAGSVLAHRVGRRDTRARRHLRIVAVAAALLVAAVWITIAISQMDRSPRPGRRTPTTNSGAAHRELP